MRTDQAAGQLPAWMLRFARAAHGNGFLGQNCNTIMCLVVQVAAQWASLVASPGFTLTNWHQDRKFTAVALLSGASACLKHAGQRFEHVLHACLHMGSSNMLNCYCACRGENYALVVTLAGKLSACCNGVRVAIFFIQLGALYCNKWGCSSRQLQVAHSVSRTGCKMPWSACSHCYSA